ncbi:MAG: hypothetical protein PVI30_01840 [Myxococcales bacterium]|jgi:hypothetical protein
MDRSAAALGMCLAATLVCEVAAAQSYALADTATPGSTFDRAGLDRAPIERTAESSTDLPTRHVGALPTGPVPGPRSMCSDPLPPLQSERTAESDGAVPTFEAAGELVPAVGAPSASPSSPTPPAPLAAAPPAADADADADVDRAPGHREGGDVPWCVSADDPRCAPIGGGGTPVRVEGRTPVSGLCTQLAGSAWPTGVMVFSARTGSRPRAGVSFRVERPPRRA